MAHLNNLHVLRVSMIRGTSVRIRSDCFKQTLVLPFDHLTNSASESAAESLRRMGWKVVAEGEGPRGWDYVIVDTFDGPRAAFTAFKKAQKGKGQSVKGTKRKVKRRK